MRNVYLLPFDLDSEKAGGCRGGVTTAPDDEINDYSLEIGNWCNADTKMLALCSAVDEVMDFLGNCSDEKAKHLKDRILTVHQSLNETLLSAYNKQDKRNK